MKFYNLSVETISRPTSDSVRIILKVPDSLRNEFEFHPGQYLTLDFEGEQRDYSIYDSPLDHTLSLAIRAHSKGKYSRFLTEELKEGETLKVSAPRGTFGIPSHNGSVRKLLAFAAGSGIAPMMSIIRYTLQTEEKVKFYLFYSNRTPRDVMFYEELEHLKDEFPHNFFPHYIYSRHDAAHWFFKGRLDADKLQLISRHIIDPAEADEAMICGPDEMVKIVSTALADAGLSAEKVHYEMYETGGLPLPGHELAESKPEAAEVTVLSEEGKRKFIWPADESLERAMTEAGIDTPVVWENGVCTRCLCRIVKGEVYMDETCVLHDHNAREGVVLSCITGPKTPSLTIEFEHD